MGRNTGSNSSFQESPCSRRAWSSREANMKSQKLSTFVNMALEVYPAPSHHPTTPYSRNAHIGDYAE